jgi:PKD repeat protein
LGPLDEYGYCAINGISATPVANFSSDKISVTVGGSITYFDLSTNTPTSWSWTFQGGTPATSTLKNPVVTYSTAGTYNVSLTVSNSSGSNTKDQAGYVTVNAVTVQAPVANFSSDKTSVTAGGAVVFSDLSTNSPTSWSWSFPGGTPSTSTAKNPVITYNTAGTYNVSLTATNSAGSNTKDLTGYINVTAVVVPAPVANFTSDKTAITEGGTVTYTDLSTNTPTAWYWSFPGGTPSTSTAKNPVVTYNTAGTYNVSLTATNASGSNTKDLTGYMTVTTVVVPAPVANFTADLTSVAEGGFVMFTDLSTNATAWTWSFPGGTPAVSTEKNPIVYYYTAGTYNVSLTVSNSAGQTNKKDQTGYITVTAVVVPPSVADFTADQTTVYPSTDVIYTDLSTNNPTSWLWVFDGGTPSTSTAKNPKVTYNTPGSYNVSLTVSNSGGSPSTKLKGSYISVMSNVVNYCSSNGTASREWISSVKVGTASKASGSSGAAGYEDFTAFKFTATAGVSYPVVLTTSYSTKTVNAETWSVWIDFNHDSDFTDPGEQVILATRVKNSLNSSLLIPKTALAGETRMRVSMKRNSLALPCEIFTNGEVEDYTINISGPGSTGSKSGITSEGAENMPMLKVYPNPATRDLNIQIGEVSEQARMEVYSMQGQLMVMQNITETITRIDLGSWPAGVYMVMVYNGNSLLREKVIKE